jgi:maltooligosyltrehalose trehalohydrolase
MNGSNYLGATLLPEGKCRFRVWAPAVQTMEVCIVSPYERTVPMTKDDRGYHQAVVADVKIDTLYFYRLDGTRQRPDPASRSQPQGVHGPSQVTDSGFTWQDSSWFGIPLRDYILYELHVGTFTRKGTFDAAIEHLDYLKNLGITAIELMPVAQFPGTRNWGYDGVYPYAVHNSYGGPEGLKRLVNACHTRGLAVVLDVVCNHLGPEGNYLWDFGPYFTDKYRTPWGPAINFDGPHSDEVRRFFIENALSWVTEFHVDSLRLDAVHGIFDFSARHFLEELTTAVREQSERLNRRVYVMAESDLNDTRLIRSRDLGGYGLDCQWNDDFHHSVHTLLTDERNGYYEDFGKFRHLVKAYAEGFVYAGQYSLYRKRRHGNFSGDLPAQRFLVFSQNHDQVGNRMLGERLSKLVSFEGLKLSAAAVLLSPFVPLLFMGEEYAETADFLYFVSHSDPDLVEAVRKGRKEEFQAFRWAGEPPDPQDETTFLKSKLDHELRLRSPHSAILQFYKEVIGLRKELRLLVIPGQSTVETLGLDEQRVLIVKYRCSSGEAVAIFHFGEAETAISLPMTVGRWIKRLDSAEAKWEGPGSSVPGEIHSFGTVSLRLTPHSALVFVRCEGD